MDSFDVNHKLNRSSSLSDLSTLTFASPTRNTSIYNSPVPKFVNLNTPFGKKGLVRHFSCEQIYDPRLGSSPLIRIKDTYSIPYQQGGDLCEPAWSNWSNFKTSLMASENSAELQQDQDKDQHQDEADIKVFGKLNNFDFSFTKDCEEKLDVIPMDIDKSLEKKSDDEVVDGDANLRKRRRVKKEDQDQGNPRKILKGSDEVDATGPGKFRTLVLVFLFLVLPVSAYLGFAHNFELSVKDNLKVLSHQLFKQRDKCDQALDFQKTLQSLQQNLYGQDQMIQDLSKNFYTKNFKLLLLTGPTGVGKTFTVEQLASTFPWTRNIFTIHHPLSTNDLKVLKLTLSHCGYNLILLDGLDKKTPEGLYDTIRDVQQFSYQNKMKTLVVLVYNTLVLKKDMTPVDGGHFDEEILEGFRKEFKGALDVSLVKFGKLKIEHVVSCVMTEASKLNLKLSRQDALKIAQDIPPIYGCKGARAKLMILKPDEDL